MKFETYNDGNGVTTVAWLSADFEPVEPGSDDAAYVKMISSSGDMAFFHVEQERSAADWNEEDHPRDDHGKFTDGGSSSSHQEVRSKLTSGKITDSYRIHGSVNDVRKVTLRDSDGNEVEAIFKPTSGESWTYADMERKQLEAYQAEHGLDSDEMQERIDEGEVDFGGGDPDEPVRETITNRDFSYADREAAAYELDEALGLGVVPPTIVREIDGKRGMVQQFVETEGLGLGDSGIDQDSVYGLAVLDIATGNTDRHSGNVLIDKDRKVVAIDQGLSFPDDTEYGENYQFRPDATMYLLHENRGAMSEEMSDRVAKSITSTNWEEMSNKWPMSDGERDRFLGRMNRLKTVFSAPDAMTRSYGIRTLISEMATQSHIAGPHMDIRHIDTDHIGTEVSR